MDMFVGTWTFNFKKMTDAQLRPKTVQNQALACESGYCLMSCMNIHCLNSPAAPGAFYETQENRWLSAVNCLSFVIKYEHMTLRLYFKWYWEFHLLDAL